MLKYAKGLLLASTQDAVKDLLYYDRKEDEELSVADVEQLIDTGKVKLCELVDTFRDTILEHFPNIERD